MKFRFSDKYFLVGVMVCAFQLILLTPVSAGLFPLISNRGSAEEVQFKAKDQVNDYNEKAIKLFEEGQFEDAQKLWEQAIQMMEQSKKGAAESPDSTEPSKSVVEERVLLKDKENFTAEDVDQLYETAVSLFKEQKYVAAKKMFSQVEAIVPDHKATRNYLTILDHKIKQTEQTLSGESFKKKVVARQEERAEWKRILYESEQELKNKLSDQVAPLYEEALGYYKKREFALAKDYFAEVDRVLPGYKDTAKYLSRIEEDIVQEEARLAEEQRKQRILERTKEKEEWKRILEESEKELQKRLTEQAEPVYRQAEEYYKKREFELAKKQFEEVQWIFPGYKSTQKYLERIDVDIQQDALLLQARRARELELKQREAELARKREEERLAQIRDEEEKRRLRAFQEEVAARRKEREEWLKVLEEKEKERQQKIKEQAQVVYAEAVQYYKEKEFQQAKQNFLEVEKLSPDYKLTKKYLSEIDEDIRREEELYLAQQKMMFEERLREKKLAEIEEKKKEEKLRVLAEEQRMKDFQQKALARQKQREEWERVIQENERRRKEKLEEEAEFIYSEALRSYKDRRWESARSDFMAVEKILPGYKLTEKYLSRIDDDIRNEERERKETARREIQRQRERELLAQKQQEERQFKIQQEEKQKRVKDQEMQAAAVYKFATSLYSRGRYEEAKENFLKVSQIIPDYKSTEKYLARIDRDITEDWEQRQKQQQIALKRQMQEQQLAKKREEERLAQEKKIEEEKRLARIREEALKREQERKEWAQTIAQIEAEHKKRLEQQAEVVYAEALRYFKAGWFQQARETFEEVDVMLPGYKLTAKYLSQIDANIEKEDQLRQASEKDILKRQQEQLKLVRKQEKERQEELRKREEESRLKKMEEEALAQHAQKGQLKNSLAQIEQEHQERLSQQTNELYSTALKYYRDKEFEKAKEAFNNVEKAFPGYRATAKYLAKIDTQIKKAEKQRQEKEQQRISRLAELESERKRQLEQTQEMYRKEEVKQVQLQKASDGQKREKKGASVLAGQVGQMEIKKSLAQIESEHHQRLNQRAEELYQVAIKHYKTGEDEKAKDAFLGVQRVMPDYKAVEKYLAKIDRRAEQETKRREQAQQREEARRAKMQEEHKQRMEAVELVRREEKAQQAQKLIEKERAELKRISEEAVVRQTKKEEFSESLAQIEESHQQQLQRQAEGFYQTALTYYKAKEFEKAKMAFINVEKTFPGYKSTAKYLSRIDRDIERQIKHEPIEQLQEIVYRKEVKPMRQEMLKQKSAPKPAEVVRKEAVSALEPREKLIVQEAAQQRQKEFSQETEEKYREALGLYKAKSFIDAKLKFIEVESLSPGYKATLNYLSRIDRDISENPEMVIEKEANTAFQQGVAFYQAKRFKEAQEKFAEADRLRPDDKATVKYLSKVRKKVEAEQARLAAKRTQTESRPQAQVMREKVLQEAPQEVPQTAERSTEPKSIGRKEIIAQALAQVERNLSRDGDVKPAVPSVARQQEDVKTPADLERDVNQRREKLKSQRNKVQQEYEKQFQQMYAKAIKLYRAGSYEEARGMFLKIEEMKPGYKRAAAYANKADAKIAQGLQKKNSNVVFQPDKAKRRDVLIEDALNAVEQRL